MRVKNTQSLLVNVMLAESPEDLDSTYSGWLLYCWLLETDNMDFTIIMDYVSGPEWIHNNGQSLYLHLHSFITLRQQVRFKST